MALRPSLFPAGSLACCVAVLTSAALVRTGAAEAPCQTSFALTARLAPSPVLKSEKLGWWSIEVEYPRFRAAGSVARAANAAAKKRERAEFDRFLGLARRETAENRSNGGTNPYDLEVGAVRIADRPNACSGYVSRYEYTGGAHGSVSFETLNFARIGGRVREVRLRDLFRPGVDAVGQASRGILAAIEAGPEDEVPALVATGAWTRLTPAQAERFAFGKSGILFLFGHYEIGSYAEGPRTVLVPWSRLPSVASWVRASVKGESNRRRSTS